MLQLIVFVATRVAVIKRKRDQLAAISGLDLHKLRKL
jgi:hypothetical protein